MGSGSRWSELSRGEGHADKYAERFAEAAAAGQDVHGEAHFVDGLLSGPSRVLDAGCGTGRVAARLAELGHDVVGVDLDAAMLERARRDAPTLTWVQSDLAVLDLPQKGFDLVVAAGNVIPLVAPGAEPTVIMTMARHLKPGGLLVAGFGLDAAHLPLAAAPFGLGAYEGWCASADLGLVERFATWDRHPFEAGGGYVVSVHRKA